MTICSGAHSDSKPASSAFSARAAAESGSGQVVLEKTIPHFMGAAYTSTRWARRHRNFRVSGGRTAGPAQVAARHRRDGSPFSVPNRFLGASSEIFGHVWPRERVLAPRNQDNATRPPGRTVDLPIS